MATAIYSVPISSLGTFIYPTLSGSQQITCLGDYEGHRYFFFPDNTVPVPTSGSASFTLVTLDDPTAAALRKVASANVQKYILSLSDAQAAAIEQLATTRLLATAAGFVYTSTADPTKTFPVNLGGVTSVSDITGLGAMAMGMKAGMVPTTTLNYQAADNVVYTLTADDVISLGAQTVAFNLTKYTDFWDASAAVMAAETVDAVNSALIANSSSSLFA